jgi:uncharacterized membrane protein YeaQ/YmgE (transglycosylase-associated protein family)
LELLGWMLVGLLVGVIARFLLPRSVTSGPVILILIGIAGAMLAGFLGDAFGVASPDSAATYVAAALGAALLILLYRLLLRYRAPR